MEANCPFGSMICDDSYDGLLYLLNMVVFNGYVKKQRVSNDDTSPQKQGQIPSGQQSGCSTAGFVNKEVDGIYKSKLVKVALMNGYCDSNRGTLWSRPDPWNMSCPSFQVSTFAQFEAQAGPCTKSSMSQVSTQNKDYQLMKRCTTLKYLDTWPNYYITLFKLFNKLSNTNTIDVRHIQVMTYIRSSVGQML